MFFRIGSFEVFTERASPQFSFFEFDAFKHNEMDREYWFLGQHIAISKVVPRTLASAIREYANGLLNRLGWDVFTMSERHALHQRAGQRQGFWDLEVERGADHLAFWGFSRYAVISRLVPKEPRGVRH